MILNKNKYGENGIFTKKNIAKNTLIFTSDDWVEDEKFGWTKMTLEELNSLSPEQKSIFLRYSYDIDFGMMIGTFDYSCAKHITNFMNHSCDPNMIYEAAGNIIAKREIKSGEELTIDYANFTVNVDQEFICQCLNSNCRKNILKDDWLDLIDTHQYQFPLFMHKQINSILNNNLTMHSV